MVEEKLTITDYINSVNYPVVLKYINNQFSVWESANDFILVWETTITKIIPKEN